MLTLFSDSIKSCRLHYRLFFTSFFIIEIAYSLLFFYVSNINYSLLFCCRFPTLAVHTILGSSLLFFNPGCTYTLFDLLWEKQDPLGLSQILCL